MAQGVAGIEQAINLGRLKQAADVRVLTHRSGERGARLPHPHGVALHPAVGLVTADAFADQGQQHVLGVDHFAQAGHVVVHPLGMDHQPVQNAAQPHQHEVEQDGGIRADDPFDRRMADIALMPQGDVFKGRQGIAPQQAGRAAHVFQLPRVALVGHGRGALLTGAERLFDFQDFGALQVAQLGRNPFQRAADQGQGREEGRVTVAGHNLGGNRLGPERESAAHKGFDLRVDIGKCADHARDFTVGNVLAGLTQTGLAALHLGVPVGGFEAKGYRLGVDAVGAADRQGLGVLAGQTCEDRQQGLNIGQQEVGRLAQLDGKRGVDDVRRGQAQVQVAPGLTQRLGHGRHKSDHIVLDLGLNLPHAGQVQDRPPAKFFGCGARNLAVFGQRLAGQQLHLQPLGEFVLFRPNLTHDRAGIAFNHMRCESGLVGCGLSLCGGCPDVKGEEVGLSLRRCCNPGPGRLV